MNVNSSQYLKEEMRNFSLYVLQHRALPSIADGLKAGGRRIMWTVKKQKKWKTATLVGATMPLHPHGDSSLETAINTLAAPYGNNHPLLEGIGSFGTRLDPTAYGAARYTSVQVSSFAEKVFYTDLELITMKPNYDNTLEEPTYFLPLVPMCLVNPIEGVAIGFACDVFSRSLDDIIETQLKVLDDKKQRDEPEVVFQPFNVKSKGKTEQNKWIFEGEFIKPDTSTVKVTNLPYGTSYENYISFLNTLIEQEKLVDYIDRSKNTINIECKFKRGELFDKDDEWIITVLKLRKQMAENINMIGFDGETVISLSYFEIVKQFTNWRLTYYKKRYERLAELLREDIQKLRDILTAIKNNVGGEAIKRKGKADLKDFLNQIGVVHQDYIASFPVYRFTKEEKEKTEKELEDSLKTLIEYEQIIASEDKQREIYKQELKQIRKEFV